jgi:hypothetical protein
MEKPKSRYHTSISLVSIVFDSEAKLFIKEGSLPKSTVELITHPLSEVAVDGT